jgi:hypothetical protein
VGDEGVAIERDLHGAVVIGAVRRDAGERGERPGRGMTIPVPAADGDQRDLGTHRVA